MSQDSKGIYITVYSRCKNYHVFVERFLTWENVRGFYCRLF